MGGEEKKMKSPMSILLLVVHGMGADGDSLRKNEREFNQVLNYVKKYWFWEMSIRIRVQFINWKAHVFTQQMNLLQKVLPSAAHSSEQATWHSNPRHLINNSLSDFLFYITPNYGHQIIENTAAQLNAFALKYLKKKKNHKTKIFLVGHSLGCVILHEILTGQVLRPSCTVPPNHEHHVSLCDQGNFGEKDKPNHLNECKDATDEEKSAYVNTEHDAIDHFLPKQKTELKFPVHGVFFLGSPLAAFYCLYESFYPKLLLPHKTPVYNIYHPHDPVAFRLESLFYPTLNPLPPSTILPHWKNNGQREYNPWNRHALDVQHAVSDYLSTVKEFATDKVRQFFTSKIPTASNDVTLAEESVHDVRNNSSSGMTLDPLDHRSFMEPAGPTTFVNDAMLPHTMNDATLHLDETTQGGIADSGRNNSKDEILLDEKKTHDKSRKAWSDPRNKNHKSQNSHHSPANTFEAVAEEKDRLCSLDKNNEKYCSEGHNSEKDMCSKRLVYQKINAHLRYGNHDRKPQMGTLAGKEVEGGIDSESVQSFLSGSPYHREAEEPRRTHGVTFWRLVKALGLNTANQEINDAVEAVFQSSTVSSSYFKRKMASTKSTRLNPVPQTNSQTTAMDQEKYAEVLSECECSGGLELPVRLDFELQELTVEHYMISLGHLLSHFNYWNSKDTAFFLLKQMTGFRPRVTYPHFVQLVNIGQTLNPSLLDKTTDNTSADSSNEEDDDDLEMTTANLKSRNPNDDSPFTEKFNTPSMKRHTTLHRHSPTFSNSPASPPYLFNSKRDPCAASQPKDSATYSTLSSFLN